MRGALRHPQRERSECGSEKKREAERKMGDVTEQRKNIKKKIGSAPWAIHQENLT